MHNASRISHYAIACTSFPHRSLYTGEQRGNIAEQICSSKVIALRNCRERGKVCKILVKRLFTLPERKSRNVSASAAGILKHRLHMYKWLDKTFPGTAKRIIVKKLLLDQFILTPPLLVIFFTGMSLMERQSSITEECRQKFLPTFARSCLFWMPAQTLNFVLVPPKFRVVYVGSCAFAWVNILCWVKRQKMLSSN
ncbi:mpv17-like protein isoform X2 [Anopheles gambiae]|nr:mpv17-like protein isoform X2 [Anopheles gambiae]